MPRPSRVRRRRAERHRGSNRRSDEKRDEQARCFRLRWDARRQRLRTSMLRFGGVREHGFEVPAADQPEGHRPEPGGGHGGVAPEDEPSRHFDLAESYKLHFQRAAGRKGESKNPCSRAFRNCWNALDADGWLLAVATGKSDRGLSSLSGLSGMVNRFVSLQTADRHPSKPHPSMVMRAMADAGAAPETTIVIGDTAFDMSMAVAARATGIGAGWGYHEAHEMLPTRRHRGCRPAIRSPRHPAG